MKSLQVTDSATLVDGSRGSIQWALDDAYIQVHGNKPKYAGRVLGVSKNILHERGNSHSYYTPSQARAQNPGSSAAMTEMIERALEAEREQHRVQMAREREEITAQVTAPVTAYHPGGSAGASSLLHRCRRMRPKFVNLLMDVE
jgi:hypothetical protein